MRQHQVSCQVVLYSNYVMVRIMTVPYTFCGHHDADLHICFKLVSNAEEQEANSGFEIAAFDITRNYASQM